MKKFLKVFFAAFFSLAIASPLNAEVFESTYDVTQCQNYELITSMLIGPGVARHPSGAKIPQTSNVQVGVFSNLVASVIPTFTNGVILSTGKITDGPSLENESATFRWADDALPNLGRDTDLNGYFGEDLSNPAGIILYIQPTNRTINIPFVMASEEFYYSRTPSADLPTQERYEQYSDKFAFFLKELGDAAVTTNAQGIVVDTSTDMKIDNTGTSADWWNVAKLRDENDVEIADVEIATVNQHTNTMRYFISNVITDEYSELVFPATDIMLPMEFNGAIVGPIAVANNLDTNKIYKLKIIIGDGRDNTVNSVVFLRDRGITSGADLKIDVTGPTALPSDGPATFTDTVSNIGPATADGVKVTHYLPLGVDPSTVQRNCEVGSYGDIFEENGTNCFVWTIGDRFKSGSNAVMTVTCELPAEGSYTNLAKVVTSTGDYDDSNNTNDHITVVGSLPTLRVAAIDTNKVYGTELSLENLEYILYVDGTNETQSVSGIDVTFTNAQGQAVDPTIATAPVGTYGICLSNIQGDGLSVFGDRVKYFPGVLTITAKEVEVSVSGSQDTKEYNGSNQSSTPILSYTSNEPSDSALFDETKVVFTGTETLTRKDVGAIPQELDPSQFSYTDANLSVTFTIAQDGKLTITPKEITVAVSGSQTTKPYNGSDQSFSPVLSYSTSETLFDKTKVSFTGTETLTRKNVGSTSQGLATSQFSYTDDNLDVTFTIAQDGKLTITPKEVTVAVSGTQDTKEYTGSDQSFTPVLSYSTTETAFDETKVAFTGTETLTRKDVGFTPQGLVSGQFSYSDSNLDVTFTISQDGKLTITPKEITIAVTGTQETKEYTGSNQNFTPVLSYSTTETAFDETKVAFTGTETLTRKDVGSTPQGLAPGQFSYSDENFAVTFTITQDGKLTITAKEITVAVSGTQDTKEYTGSNQSFTPVLSYSTTETTFDETKVTFSGTETLTRKDVGSTPQELAPGQFSYSDANLIVTFTISQDGKLTITPKEITVAVSGSQDTKEYTGSDQSFTPVLSYSTTETTFDETKVSFTGTETLTRKDVGSTPQELAPGQFSYTDSNFAVTFTIAQDGKFTITPKEITVAVSGTQDTKEYTGSDQSFTPVLSYSTTETTFDETKVTFTGTETLTRKDVGSTPQELAPSQFSYTDDNLVVTFTISQDGKLTITPKAITVAVSGSQETKEYTGSDQSFTPVLSYASNEPSDSALFDETKVTFTGTETLTRKDVGSTPQELAPGQFSYSDANLVVTFTISQDGKFTITAKEITVAVSGTQETKEYTGSDQSFTPVLSYSTTEATFDETKVTFTGTETLTRKDVGSTPQELAPGQFSYSDANLVVTFTISQDGKLTITPKAITVAVSGSTATKLYNGFDQSFTPVLSYATPETAFDETKVTFTGTETLTRMDVGSTLQELAPGQFSYADDNLSVTFTIAQDGKLTITMKEITVAVSGSQDTKEFTGSDQSFTPALSYSTTETTFDETKVTFTGTETLTRKDVGSTPQELARSEVSSTEDNLPTSFTFVQDGKLTITPKEITVAVTGTQDTKEYTGSDQSFTPVLSYVSNEPSDTALFDETKVTFTGTETLTRKDVGSTPQELAPSQFSYTDENLAVTFTVSQDGKLAITPKTITIIAKDAAKAYGEVLTFTGGPDEFTVDGLSDGEQVTSVVITSDKAEAPGTDVGVYEDEIVPDYEVMGIDTNNYNIVFSNGTLTVTQAVLTITVNDAVWKVGRARPSYSFADFSSQLKAGDTVADVTGGSGLATDVDYTNAVWNASEPADSDEGTYADEIWIDLTSLDGAKAANYLVDIDPGDLVVRATEAVLKTTISASLNWNTGLLDLEMTIKNTGDGEVDPDFDYWVELEAGPRGVGPKTTVEKSYYIASPTGTMPDGYDYIELTSKVKAALRAVGNRDEVFDPGESVTVKGVSVYHWKRWSPEKFIDADSFFVAGRLFSPADANRDFVVSEEEKTAAASLLGSNSADYLEVSRLALLPYYHWSSSEGTWK